MTEPVSIRVSVDAEPIEFRSFAQLRKWHEDERAHWGWLLTGAGPTTQHNVHHRVMSTFEEIRVRLTDNEMNGQPLDGMISFVEQRYLPDGSALISSTSPEGAIVGALLEKAGQEAAVFAYAFRKGWVNFGAASNPMQINAALSVAMPALINLDDLSAKMQRERANFKHALQTSLNAIDEERSAHEMALNDQQARMGHGYKRGRRFALRALRHKVGQWQEQSKFVEQSFREAVDQFRAVEQTYRTFMGLKAPVEYWRDKSEEHRKAETQAGYRLGLFFPVAIVTMIFAFWISAAMLVGFGSVPQTVYFIISAGLATIAGMIFWIGRLLNRLYLSAHHLRVDAEERAVMTQAFLALSAEGAAIENDRVIVLNALFRPSADGLVKDDGPDLSIPAVLARFGSR